MITVCSQEANPSTTFQIRYSIDTLMNGSLNKLNKKSPAKIFKKNFTRKACEVHTKKAEKKVELNERIFFLQCQRTHIHRFVRSLTRFGITERKSPMMFSRSSDKTSECTVTTNLYLFDIP